jgi:hypothetical protein
MRRSMLGAALLTACVLSACASPPDKEINQAQGAIDAARAAGADRYAEGAFLAATTALRLATESVTQREYRQALNYALESREHAQNAAREAAENRARIRGEVERSMAEIAALLAQANVRLADADTARVPRQTLRTARQTLTQVNTPAPPSSRHFARSRTTETTRTQRYFCFSVAPVPLWFVDGRRAPRFRRRAA